MSFKLGARSRERLQGIDTDLIEVVELALTISPIDFGIPQYGGLRTTEDQRILYTGGKSNADGITHKSYHQTGKAFDIYAYVDGKASWDELHLTTCAVAIMQAANVLGVTLEWGGFFKSILDRPHFQKPRA